ncbi:nucleotide-diphospho-sugar transferase [Pseudoneurospora amorphoporcata]|uniref:Nucleotide-diphospho-sugar transferase n=1 Tax=Pseudoneurospora amorphoporcata TaxID=241081 RepID=A0AAN6NJ31_9PEZI|nr:nucleotide-diphospho-sugar transferase [Pseudoneurospora amorphoporcata]
MPAITVRFLGLAALSAVILLNTQAMIHIGHFFSGPSLTQAAVASTFHTAAEDKRQSIPKIIHQIYHNGQDHSNETLPADRDEVHHSCTTTNPDFEYRLWTTNSSRQFVETHYEWFLETYDSYTCPAQRLDTLRYFLMRHYGGIYIDPNYSCSRDIQPLLYYPAWVMDSHHGISGARPHHPYWVMIIESLAPRGHRFQSPNLPITHSGGPEFESAVWKRYHTQLPTKPRKEDRVYRIKMGHREEAFFKPNARFKNPWDNNFEYIALGCLLLFAMFTLWVARSWQARKTHQREYQRLLLARDQAGGYGTV